MRHPVRFLLIALVVGLLAAACAGGDDAAELAMRDDDWATTTWAAAETTIAQPAGAPGFGQDEGEAAVGGDADIPGVVAVLQPGDLGRSIVYTASLEIEVDDVVAAGRQALAELQGLGAVLFGQETNSGAEPRSVLTIKVPPASFSTALDRLAGLGTLLSQTIYADDVTERVVDLESRITTAEASVARLRAFLEQATTTADVAELEAQLLQRETDLELLRGQLRTLEDQVALATIVLGLTQQAPGPAMELVATAYAGHDPGCPGSEELSLKEGDLFTMCYEVRNVGDTLLGEIEVSDPGLEARFEDMVAVEGNPDVPLAPGGRLIFAFPAEADPDRWTSPQVQATALDANGTPLWQQVELAKVDEVTLQVARDDSLPGFGDALSGAWHALQRFGGALVVIGGVLVPWLWIPALAALAWWWRRRRKAAAAVASVAGTPAAPPAEPDRD